MAKWLYTLDSGSDLREAIENDELEQTAQKLVACLKELNSKLSEEDEAWKGWDIEDLIDNITADIDYGDIDEDDLNDYLDEFYDICDDVRAWIGGI